MPENPRKEATWPGTRTVVFDKDKLDELRHCYRKAIKAGDDIFLFDGREILVAYAKYMIEYLEIILT